MNFQSFNSANPAISRFAPSPTGFLHQGHVLNAIFVWGITKFLNGKVILRIEDHDQSRSRPEHIQNVYDTLEWLGFEADIIAPYQSENNNRYKHFIELLDKKKLIYNCKCTRKRIQSFQDENSSELKYDNKCRELNLFYDKSSGINLRIKIKSEDVKYENYYLDYKSKTICKKNETQNPAEQCGDFALRDKQGQWTYHFAVCVDDIDQGVNLVIRGMDLVDSTARQILLTNILSSQLHDKLYFHHPLLYNSSGEKLSKRQKDFAVLNMRKETSPEKLLGKLCYDLGLISNFKSITPIDLAEVFSTVIGHS